MKLNWFVNSDDIIFSASGKFNPSFFKKKIPHGFKGYIIIPEKDSSALAKAIADIVEDRNQRKKMAIAVRERANEYT